MLSVPRTPLVGTESAQILRRRVSTRVLAGGTSAAPASGAAGWVAVEAASGGVEVPPEAGRFVPVIGRPTARRDLGQQRVGLGHVGARPGLQVLRPWIVAQQDHEPG